MLRDGTDVTIIATGPVMSMACEAADQLTAEGVSVRLLDMHTVKPLDADLVEQAARETGAIVTIEEHSVIGGLGGAVCEAVCERCPVPVVRVGVPDRFGESGDYAEILARAGISSENVVESARRAMAAKAG